MKTAYQKLTEQKKKTLARAQSLTDDYSIKFKVFASKLILRGATAQKVLIVWKRNKI
jgi:hypothetical protein